MSYKLELIDVSVELKLIIEGVAHPTGVKKHNLKWKKLIHFY